MESVTQPPDDIAEVVAAISPDSFERALHGRPADDDPEWEEGWRSMTELFDLTEEAAAIDVPHPGIALCYVLMTMPEWETHELSRRHPVEMLCVAGTAWCAAGADEAQMDMVMDVYLAPEVREAFLWRYGDCINEFYEACSVMRHLN